MYAPRRRATIRTYSVAPKVRPATIGKCDMATTSSVTAPSAIQIDDLFEYDRVFQDAFNAADLEGLVSLYESDAVFVPSPGQVATGTDSLREVFASFLATKPSFELKMTSLHQVGDLALESSTWKMKGNDPEGNPMALGGTCSGVLRLQSDGRWLFVIDNPFASE